MSIVKYNCRICNRPFGTRQRVRNHIQKDHYIKSEKKLNLGNNTAYSSPITAEMKTIVK